MTKGEKNRRREAMFHICRVKAYELIQQCHNMGKLSKENEVAIDIHYWTDEEKKSLYIKDINEKGLDKAERDRRLNWHRAMKYAMEEECDKSSFYYYKANFYEGKELAIGYRVSVTKDYITVKSWTC